MAETLMFFGVIAALAFAVGYAADRVNRMMKTWREHELVNNRRYLADQLKGLRWWFSEDPAAMDTIDAAAEIVRGRDVAQVRTDWRDRREQRGTTEVVNSNVGGSVRG